MARLLGIGGMGRVYLAVQPAIGARVAIKVLRHEAGGSADLVERFFNEARAVNVIRHESIIDVIDLGQLADGSPYIVMEYLEGASLGALFRRHRPFPLGMLVQLAAQALAALAAAHRKGIIHRDLKPDNLFVSPAGQVTVLDFGIAKLAAFDGSATQSGMLLGTPAYMAPEQARAEAVDPRADLYSMGVILFEGATGRLPFAAGSMYELLDLQVNETPPPPRSINPAIPEAIEAVIVKALAKHPDERFAIALEMRTALLAAFGPLPRASFADLGAPVGVPGGALAATITPQPQLSVAPGGTVASIAPGPRSPQPQQQPAPPPHLAPGSAPPARRRGALIAVGGVVLVTGGMAGALALRSTDEPSAVHTVPGDAAPRDATRTIPSPSVDAAPSGAAPPPGDANARRVFNPHAYFVTALARARAIGGEVRPVKMSWRDVRPDGTIDATDNGLMAMYVFVKTGPDASEGDCVIAVHANKEGTVRDLITGGACRTMPQMGPPNCTPPQLWRRARATRGSDGRGVENASLANLERVFDYWQFSATRPDDSSYFVELKDDCE